MTALSDILHVLYGLLAGAIGAVPFGLVNLSVMHTAVNRNTRPAMLISSGATLIELIYALIALLSGKILVKNIQENNLVHFFIFTILVAAAVLFWFRKNHKREIEVAPYQYFTKGIVLNLLSVQVFLYWVMAIGFLSTNELVEFRWVSIILFLFGIGVAKMAILYSYARAGEKILSRSHWMTKNMNRIVAGILLIGAIVQIGRL